MRKGKSESKREILAKLLAGEITPKQARQSLERSKPFDVIGMVAEFMGDPNHPTILQLQQGRMKAGVL